MHLASGRAAPVRFFSNKGSRTFTPQRSHFSPRPVVSLALIAAVSITGSRYLRSFTTATMAKTGAIKHIPSSSLFVSEPPPNW